MLVLDNSLLNPNKATNSASAKTSYRCRLRWLMWVKSQVRFPFPRTRRNDQVRWKDRSATESSTRSTFSVRVETVQHTQNKFRWRVIKLFWIMDSMESGWGEPDVRSLAFCPLLKSFLVGKHADFSQAAGWKGWLYENPAAQLAKKQNGSEMKTGRFFILTEATTMLEMEFVLYDALSNCEFQDEDSFGFVRSIFAGKHQRW